MEKDLIKITMLGGFQIQAGDKTVLGQLAQSRKATLLLQYLLLERDRRVTHQELTDSLWGSEASGNPDMALRAILHRLRLMADAENLPELENCIVTHRGSYQWNNNLLCQVDIYTMQKLAEQARCEEDEARLIGIYESIVGLYHGRLLPGSAGEPWVERKSVQLHGQYQVALLGLLELYKKRSWQKKVVELCHGAILVDHYDEQLYMELIMALNALGRNDEAQQVSQYAAELGYLHLNTAGPREINTAYRRLIKADRCLENDINKIFGNIERADDTGGALLCGYAVFREIYRLQFRIQERYGMPLFLALITIAGSAQKPDPQELAGAMDALEKTLLRQLRRSDVISQYSGNQYVVLLAGTIAENGANPLERVKTEFYRDPRHASCALSYRLRAPEPRHTPKPARRARKPKTEK